MSEWACAWPDDGSHGPCGICDRCSWRDRQCRLCGFFHEPGTAHGCDECCADIPANAEQYEHRGAKFYLCVPCAAGLAAKILGYALQHLCRAMHEDAQHHALDWQRWYWEQVTG